jgi:hypothetical protein
MSFRMACSSGSVRPLRPPSNLGRSRLPVLDIRSRHDFSLDVTGQRHDRSITPPRRYDRVHGAPDEPVALEVPERLGEHALADAVDLALELGEPQGPALEQRDGQQRPLVGDPVEDLSDVAVMAGVSRIGCRPTFLGAAARRVCLCSASRADHWTGAAVTEGRRLVSERETRAALR